MWLDRLQSQTIALHLLRHNILQMPRLRKQNKTNQQNIIKTRNQKHEKTNRSTRRILHEKIQRNGNPNHTPQKRKHLKKPQKTITIHTKRGVNSTQKTPRSPRTHQSIQPITTIQKQERKLTIITPRTDRLPKPERHGEKTLSTPRTDERP